MIEMYCKLKIFLLLRYIRVPEGLAVQFPYGRMMSVKEWRSLGIILSANWEHYAYHFSNAQIIFFRRPIRKRPASANPPITVNDTNMFLQSA